MPKLKFIEDGELTGTRITRDGYLTANVRCARTGIQAYAGYELGMPEVERVRIYRPGDEVFSTDSLATFAGKPATDNHPAEPVTAQNWKQFAVGSIGSDVLRDGEYVRVPLILMDADVIQKVQDGKREISMGYDMTVDFTPGKTAEGEEYDAVMRDLRMNHLAIVDRGRAGNKVRIGDSWAAFAQPSTTTDAPTQTTGGNEPMTLRKILVDGLSVETTDAGAQAIEKLQTEKQALSDAADQQKAAHDAALTEKQAAHDTAIAEKDTQLAAKDAEIADLKGKILDDAALDKRVAERAELITKASAIAKDTNFTGKSDLEIKTAAVIAKHGADFAADKSPVYIDAAFDLLKVPQGTGDSFRDAMIGRKPPADTQNDNGQAAYEKRLNDAWKGGAA